MLRFIGLAALTACVASGATAQGVPNDAALLECRTLSKNSARLQCYDRALDAIYGVDEALQAKREQDRRDRFGLPVDDDGLQMTELTATITAVDANLRTNLTYIALDNGQTWELLSSGGLRTRMKPGMQVVISESGTGGYRLRVPEKTGYRGVNRVK